MKEKTESRLNKVFGVVGAISLFAVFKNLYPQVPEQAITLYIGIGLSFITFCWYGYNFLNKKH